VKNLALCFALFLGILYALERTDIWVIASGVGALMAAIVFIHILSTPDSAGAPKSKTPQG